MEYVFKTLDLSDDNENFREYTKMIELYNVLKFITMLLFIKKISRFNLGVAFLKSVSIYGNIRNQRTSQKQLRGYTYKISPYLSCEFP